MKRYRTKGQRKEPERLGPIIDEYLSQKGYYSICKEYSILHKWPAIVGPVVAKATQCEKIDAGTVYVKTATASWRQEMAYSKAALLQKIQKEFGCPTIKDIVFY